MKDKEKARSDKAQASHPTHIKFSGRNIPVVAKKPTAAKSEPIFSRTAEILGYPFLNDIPLNDAAKARTTLTFAMLAKKLSRPREDDRASAAATWYVRLI